MENDDLNEYNSIGAPSEEVKRKLRYLAEIGSEAVTSAFRVSSGYEGRNIQEKRDAADEQFYALAELAMASQEQVSQFNAGLDDIESRRLTLLTKLDDDLRNTRKARW